MSYLSDVQLIGLGFFGFVVVVAWLQSQVFTPRVW